MATTDMSSADATTAGSTEAILTREAQLSVLPVLPPERTFGFLDFTWVSTGLAIATWAFLIGGSTAVFLGVKAGIAANIIGVVIAATLMLLATVIPSNKYGTEQFTIMRTILGRNGVRIVVYIWMIVLELGWTAVLAVMFGRSTRAIVNGLGDYEFGPDSWVVVVGAIVCIAASWLILARGPVAMKYFNRIVAPGLALVTVFLLIFLFSEYSWSEIIAVKPLEPFDDKLLNFMLVIEFNLAGAFAWFGVIGNLARLGKTQRTAFWPGVIGLIALSLVAQTVGIISAAMLGTPDPTEWMIPAGGNALGVVVLIFIGFANITSVVAVIYSTMLALRTVGGSRLNRVRWEWLTGAFFFVSVFLVLKPSLIYDNFFQFLLWSGIAYAPMTGVYLVDYYFLRKRHVDIRALYDLSENSKYRYWSEWNLPGLIAVVVGSVSYIPFLNPKSLDHITAFKYVSASIPSLVIGAIVYIVLTKVWTQRVGKGGYRASN